jgi:hypothetical protein
MCVDTTEYENLEQIESRLLFGQNKSSYEVNSLPLQEKHLSSSIVAPKVYSENYG